MRTAAYIANIAILVEESETRYQLNSVINKDKDELRQWRSTGTNKALENKAREIYEDKQETLKKKKLLDEQIKHDEKIKLEEKEKKEEIEAKTMLHNLSKNEILTLLQKTNISGDSYRILQEELKNRSKRQY